MASVWREIRAAITDKVFWLIVVTGILGFAGQSAWTIPLLAVLLTAVVLLFLFLATPPPA